MPRKIPMLTTGFLLAASIAVGQPKKLSHIIPTLFGPEGLFVDSEALLPSGATHSAHFNSAFQSEFTQFNIALASQLTAVPLPSPASGFTYSFDEATGTFDRTTTSFGPILAERAETIGKGKFNFGFNFQAFTFDNLEGNDLSDVRAVFTHDGAAPGGKADVVTTSNAIDARVNQFTTFLSYGITDRMDLSIGIPLASADLSVTSRAVIQRLGTAGNPAVHFFEDEHVDFGDGRTFVSEGTASGIGDIIIRVKNNVVRSNTGLAVGVDARLPTGDEENLLGSGAFGLKPFLAFSMSHSTVSPHVNLGYQWNGESLLGGNVLAGEKADLPDQLNYAIGVDLGISRGVTVAVDLLGVRVFDSPQLQNETFVGLDPAATRFPDIGFESRSFNETAGAIGVKVHPGSNFLVNFNVVFALDDNGLRDRMTPLFGIEYGF